MTEFFRINLVVVQFLYGLIFFSLGLAIIIQPRRGSAYDLARQLNWLALFGILHAFADWGHIFIPLQAGWASPLAVQTFWALRSITSAVSFGFLLYFGISLLVPTTRRIAWSLLPTFLVAVWLILLVAPAYIAADTITRDWLGQAEALSRYVLALPAGILTALGLWRQAGSLRSHFNQSHIRYLRTAGGGFLVYGLMAGLVVKGQPFFPVVVLNDDTFFRVTGMPVEFVRGVVIGVVSLFTIRLMDIFNVETQRRIQKVEQDRALLRLKEQIARDLHDGIMQTLYGTGLGLKQITALAGKNPALAAEMSGELGREIGRSIVQMRSFVMDLKDEGTTGAEVAEEVRSLVATVTQASGIPVDVRIEGCDQLVLPMPTRVREDALAVVREGLCNVVRQARQTTASVVLSVDEDTLLLRISDSGRGYDSTFSAESGDLASLRERIEGAGGLLQILSGSESERHLVAHLPIQHLQNALRHSREVTP